MNKLYEESAIQDIASAIREKNGSTATYKVAQMGNAIRDISSGIDVSQDTVTPDTLLSGFTAHNAQGEAITGEVKYRIFKGEVTETIVGSGKYVALLKNDFLKDHRNDENILVRVIFDVEAQPYTIYETWSTNKTRILPIDTEANYQAIKRFNANSVKETPMVAYKVNQENGLTAGVGHTHITADGELRVYSNSSSNYAIRPCNFTVIIEW